MTEPINVEQLLERHAEALAELTDLGVELEEALAEVDRLRGDVQYWTDVAATQHQALAFYADPANWEQRGVRFSPQSFTFVPATLDRGERARAVLAGRTEEPRHE